MSKIDLKKKAYSMEMEPYLKELLMILIVIVLSLIPIGINKYILGKSAMDYNHLSILNIILFVIVVFLSYIWSRRGDCKVVFTVIVSLIIIGVGVYIATASGCDISGTMKCDNDAYLSISIGINIVIYMTLYILIYIWGRIERKIIK